MQNGSKYIEIYNISSNTWTDGINEGQARADHSAVVYGDGIYFFGGQGNNGILNSLQVYDTQSQSLTTLSSCSQARYGHAAFVHKHEMFIWGCTRF